MTVEELLRRGGECEAAGDVGGAEEAYRSADALDDPEGAILLGLVLQRRGDLAHAADAFRRAESRGHPEAGSQLGNLLSDTGDFDAAKAAYERSIAAGSVNARLNLGLMLAQQGGVQEAIPHLTAAEQAGDAVASWAIGKIREGQQDLQGAADAYCRGADGGSAHAAFGLGAVLVKLDDRAGARAAFERARELGHENAEKALETLEIEADARSSVETASNWAQLYAAACGEVFAAANACLEVANRAIGARNMASQRPQHEISIRNFTKMAEQQEAEFAPLYRAFDEACTAARDTAAQFLAAQPDPLLAETVLATTVDEAVLDNVATVKAILSASYGSTPTAFLQGVQESNELMQTAGADDGNIYRPPAATASDERTCPWCAETIKAAAVICRFCGRDVQVQANVG